MGEKKIYDNLRAEREIEIESKINKKLEVKTRTLRANESLRTVVLHCVFETEYDMALEVLGSYAEQFTGFLNFQSRVDPYIKHCISLVYSIKVKRNFPGMTSLPFIKQQEVMDNVIHDFNQLRIYLARIEAMHNEVIYKDILSMNILIQTITFSAVILIVALGAIAIGMNGLGFVNAFLDEMTTAMAGWFV